MRTLLIHRHGKSSWKGGFSGDFYRPLNQRGRRDAPAMAKRLKEKSVHFDTLVTSPAVRALNTAKIVAGIYGLPEAEIICKERLYLGRVDEFMWVINHLPDSNKSVILFGHNPGVTDVVNYLTGAGISNIPTCGVAVINFDIDIWQAAYRNTGVLEFMDYPKKISKKQFI